MPSHRRRGEVLDTALGLAGPILDVLETGLELVPVPGIGLIPKALSVVVDSVKVARANKESRNAFEAKVKNLGSLIEVMRQRAGALGNDYTGSDEAEIRREVVEVAHSQELQDGVRELNRVIRTLETSAASLRERRGIRGFIKETLHGSRNEAIIADMQAELANAIEIFQLKGQFAIDRGVQGLQRLLLASEETNSIDKLAWADAGYRAVDHLKSGFMDGTRQTLFKNLRTWCAGRFPDSYPKRFYFLKGSAGLGKSAVAHRLCRYLADENAIDTLFGASFFFVRGGTDNGSALLLFSTLARQLAGCHPAVKAQIANACLKYTQQGHRQQINYAFECLLLKPLTQASKFISPGSRVVIVLDGLDECAENDLMAESLRLLLTLVRTLPWLYVFAASRPEPHIMSVVTSPETVGLVHHQDMGDASASWNDVALYLQSTIPKIGTYDQYLRSDPRPLKELIQRAGGVFIFARVAVNVLDDYRDYPEEGFRLALSSRGEELSPLDSLYLQILRSAFPRNQMQNAPRLHAHLLSLLYIIALQQQPLPPGTTARLGNDLCQEAVVQNRLSKAIRTQLGMTERDVVTMIGRLRSALSIDANGNIAPMHATFAEFLLDPARCTDPLYHLDRGEGHAGLAAVCFGALTIKTATEILAARKEEIETVVLYGAYISTTFFVHMNRAANTQELERRKVEFIRSCQLPIAFVVGLTATSSTAEELLKLWIDMIMGSSFDGSSEDDDDHRRSAVGHTANGSDFADEVGKFCAYSIQYLNNLRDLPEKTWQDITAREVRDYVVDAAERHGPRIFSERASLWESATIDVETYRSFLDDLRGEIEQDERRRHLWYDFALEYWW